MYNFTLRIYQPSSNSSLELFDTLNVSGIWVLNKQTKFSRVEGNRDLQIYLDWKRLHTVAGSNSYPCIAFRGEYLDIKFRNFPRFPIVGHEFSWTEPSSVRTLIRNLEAGYSYENVATWPKYRKTEILNLKPTQHERTHTLLRPMGAGAHDTLR